MLLPCVASIRVYRARGDNAPFAHKQASCRDLRAASQMNSRQNAAQSPLFVRRSIEGDRWPDNRTVCHSTAFTPAAGTERLALAVQLRHLL